MNDSVMKPKLNLSKSATAKAETETPELQTLPTLATTVYYHVCVVARIKGDNIFSDAMVNVPQPVTSVEDISALRNAMAQQLGALPERVTIVRFQHVPRYA